MLHVLQLRSWEREPAPHPAKCAPSGLEGATSGTSQPSTAVQLKHIVRAAWRAAAHSRIGL